MAGEHWGGTDMNNVEDWTMPEWMEPFRDLFTLRIGLRLNESEQVDLVLGDGAYDRGAWCDRISDQTPGVGYVILEGNPAPVRVRLSYLDDADISEMAGLYAATNVVPLFPRA